MKPIPRSNQVYYIKLGPGGCWEEECIEKDQTVQMGYSLRCQSHLWPSVFRAGPDRLPCHS